MKYWQRCKLLLVLSGLTLSLHAQTSSSPARWDASWISLPSADRAGYGVYLFRKQFDLTNYSGPFVIHCSADNRYRLYVNGKFVAMGPAKSDLSNWYYETIDIGPFLKYGVNTLAAEVVNFGEFKPRSQFSHATGLLVQGNTAKEAAIINTGTTWKGMEDASVTVWPVSTSGFYGAYPGDSIISQYKFWGWEQPGYDDSKWEKAVVTGPVALQGNSSQNWRLLAPREVNALMMEKRRFVQLKENGEVKPSGRFLEGVQPLTIPAKQKISLLFDAGEQTAGFPELLISGGLDANINLTYLPDYTGVTTLQDYIRPDGASRRTFIPTGYRTFRYIQVDIATNKAPLTIHDYCYQDTRNLLTDRSAFAASPGLDTLWKAARHLALAGAQDNLYEDTYTEQLQYISSARIHGQAIAAFTGDLQLFRQAIWLADQSRIPEGLIRDRYPSDDRVVSISSSLQWIGALQDYLMWKADRQFAKQLYPGVKQVIGWYEKYADANGIANANMPYRNEAPAGTCAYQYLLALRQAAQIAGFCEQPSDSAGYTKTADRLRETLYQQLFNQDKGLFTSASGREVSRYATALAILAQAVPPKQIKSVIQHMLAEKPAPDETLYEKYLIGRAVMESGFTEQSTNELQPIQAMLEQHHPAFFRSGASMVNLWLLGITAGIQPASYGYRTVLIAPEPGNLSAVQATMVHPDGNTMGVDLQFRNNRVKGKVNLPFGVTGKFRWRGKEITLHGGPQEVSL